MGYREKSGREVKSETPLFPPLVYAKLCIVPDKLQPSNLKSIIKQALALNEKDIQVNEFDYGHNYIWNEVESVRLGEMKWIAKEAKSLVITGIRVATLTRPLDDGKRVLGILAPSQAVAVDIFEIIRSLIAEQDYETKNDNSILSNSVISKFGEEIIINMKSITINDFEGPFSFANFIFKNDYSLSSKRKSISNLISSGKVNAIGMNVNDISLLIRENDFIIGDANTEFNQFPNLLESIYDIFIKSQFQEDKRYGKKM